MATFQVAATILTFRLLLDGAELAQPSALSVRHIPGGNVTYLDNGGLEAPTLKGRAQLTSFADVLIFLSLQGQDGALSYSEAAVGVATLRSCTRSKATGRGDVQFVNVEWILDDTTITTPGVA